MRLYTPYLREKFNPTEFSAREVAVLADVPVRAVDKAIEGKARAGIRAGRLGRRRMLPLHAVRYAAIVVRLPVTLSLTTKRDLARKLGKRSAARMTDEP